MNAVSSFQSPQSTLPLFGAARRENVGVTAQARHNGLFETLDQQVTPAMTGWQMLGLLNQLARRDERPVNIKEVAALFPGEENQVKAFLRVLSDKYETDTPPITSYVDNPRSVIDYRLSYDLSAFGKDLLKENPVDARDLDRVKLQAVQKQSRMDGANGILSILDREVMDNVTGWDFLDILSVYAEAQQRDSFLEREITGIFPGNEDKIAGLIKQLAEKTPSTLSAYERPARRFGLENSGTAYSVSPFGEWLLEQKEAGNIRGLDIQG